MTMQRNPANPCLGGSFEEMQNFFSNMAPGGGGEGGGPQSDVPWWMRYAGKGAGIGGGVGK